jgi:Helix-turn-helix domain
MSVEMSVEAISWALNLAPVPAGRRGQPSSACKFVLVGLANHAGPDGREAFPSVVTLVRYTGLSERTVRTCLDRLEAGGIIRPCDPDPRRGADQARRPTPPRLGPGPQPGPATTSMSPA